MSFPGKWCGRIVLLALYASGRIGAGSATADPALTIGLLNRPDEEGAQSLYQGAALAVSNLNASVSCRVHLVVRGRPGQWGTDGDEAAVLALDDGADAIIASGDGATTHQALQVAGRTQVPVVSLCADSSVTKTGVPWAVRLVPRTDEEARCIFQSAEAKSAKRWAMVIPAERAGRETGRDLRNAAAGNGVKLIFELALPDTAAHTTMAVQELLRAHSDGVLLWVEASKAGALARALRGVQYRGILAGPARLQTSRFTQAAGDAAQGFVLPLPRAAVASAEHRRAFVAAYQRQYGCQPDFLAAMSYDAVQLLVLTSSKVRGATVVLPQSRLDAGLFGPIAFDVAGNRVLTLSPQIGANGEFR